MQVGKTKIIRPAGAVLILLVATILVDGNLGLILPAGLVASAHLPGRRG